MPVVAAIGPAIGAIGSAIGGGLAAIGGGSALAGASTVAGIAGQFLGSRGAGGAAQSGMNAQVDASREATALQKYMYDTTRADNEPWRQTGVQALARLNSLYGFDTSGGASGGASTAAPQVAANQTSPDASRDVLQGFGRGGPIGAGIAAAIARNNQNGATGGGAGGGLTSTQPVSQTQVPATGGQAFLEMDPGYQFRLSEGINAFDRSAASRGRTNSGGTMKALTRYTQGFASNEFANAYNRMANLAGLGQTVNASNSAAGQNYANQAGQNFFNAGQARASGYANQSAARNQMWGGLANAAGNIFGGGGFGQPGVFSPGWIPNSAPANDPLGGLF